MDNYYINVNENSERYGWVVTFDESKYHKDAREIQLHCPRLGISFKEEHFMQDYRGIERWVASGLSYIELDAASYKETIQKAKDMPKNMCPETTVTLLTSDWISLRDYSVYELRMKTFYSENETITITWYSDSETPFSVHQYDAKDIMIRADDYWEETVQNKIFQTKHVEELLSYISEEEFRILLNEFQDELED